MLEEDDDVIEQGARKALPRPPLKPLIAIAAVLAVAAGVAVAVAQPWSHPQRTTLPDPCRLLPAATVTKYVTGAAARGPVLFTSTTRKTGVCGWVGTYTGSSAGIGPMLQLEVDQYPTPARAQQDFGTVFGTAMLSTYGQAASTRPVRGVGDQASAAVTDTLPGQPLVILAVRSGTTLVELTYLVPPPPSGSPPDDTAVIADTVAIARAALSDFGTAPTAAASPIVLAAAASSSGPRYSVPANPCHLIAGGTVREYLGAGSEGTRAPGYHEADEATGGCYWITAGPYYLSVSITAFSPATTEHVQEAFERDVESFTMFGPGGTSTFAPRAVPDLGTQAEAVFTGSDTMRAVIVTAWSGNAEITVSLTIASTTSPTAELSNATAAARAVLAALPRA